MHIAQVCGLCAHGVSTGTTPSTRKCTTTSQIFSGAESAKRPLRGYTPLLHHVNPRLKALPPRAPQDRRWRKSRGAAALARRPPQRCKQPRAPAVLAALLGAAAACTRWTAPVKPCRCQWRMAGLLGEASCCLTEQDSGRSEAGARTSVRCARLQDVRHCNCAFHKRNQLWLWASP